MAPKKLVSRTFLASQVPYCLAIKNAQLGVSPHVKERKKITDYCQKKGSVINFQQIVQCSIVDHMQLAIGYWNILRVSTNYAYTVTLISNIGISAKRCCKSAV